MAVAAHERARAEPPILAYPTQRGVLRASSTGRRPFRRRVGGRRGAARAGATPHDQALGGGEHRDLEDPLEPADAGWKETLEREPGDGQDGCGRGEDVDESAHRLGPRPPAGPVTARAPGGDGVRRLGRRHGAAGIGSALRGDASDRRMSPARGGWSSHRIVTSSSVAAGPVVGVPAAGE